METENRSTWLLLTPPPGTARRSGPVRSCEEQGLRMQLTHRGLVLSSARL
jgi:hypothetical protein